MNTILSNGSRIKLLPGFSVISEKDGTYSTNNDFITENEIKKSANEHECFVVLFPNNQHKLIKAVEMFVRTASVSPRDIVKTALKLKAAVILSHNYPSGITEPSQADKSITVKVKDALNMLDIRNLTHIIVGGVDSFSLAEGGLI